MSLFVPVVTPLDRELSPYITTERVLPPVVVVETIDRIGDPETYTDPYTAPTRDTTVPDQGNVTVSTNNPLPQPQISEGRFTSPDEIVRSDIPSGSWYGTYVEIPATTNGSFSEGVEKATWYDITL